jgi:hypothetical protein
MPAPALLAHFSPWSSFDFLGHILPPTAGCSVPYFVGLMTWLTISSDSELV